MRREILARLLLRPILASILLLLPVAAAQAGETPREHTVAPGIGVTAQVREVQWLNDRDAVAVRFDLIVRNSAGGDATIALGRIVTRYDGEDSRETRLVETEGRSGDYGPVRLPPGRTTYRLYSLFSESVSLSAESSFRILEAGIEVAAAPAGQPAPDDGPRNTEWTARRDIVATIDGEPAPVFQDPAFPEDLVIYDMDLRGRADSRCWIFNLAWQDVREAGCGSFRARAGGIALRPDSARRADAPLPGRDWRDAIADCRVSRPTAGQEPQFARGAIRFMGCQGWITVRFSRHR